MKPNTDSKGLSRIFDILYSKFWPATRGLKSSLPKVPGVSKAQIWHTFASVDLATCTADVCILLEHLVKLASE